MQCRTFIPGYNQGKLAQAIIDVYLMKSTINKATVLLQQPIQAAA